MFLYILLSIMPYVSLVRRMFSLLLREFNLYFYLVRTNNIMFSDILINIISYPYQGFGQIT